MGVIPHSALASTPSAQSSITQARSSLLQIRSPPHICVRWFRKLKARPSRYIPPKFRLPWGLDYRYVLPIRDTKIPATQTDNIRMPGPYNAVSPDEARVWLSSRGRQAQVSYNKSLAITRHYHWPDAAPPSLWAERYANVRGGFTYGDGVNVPFSTRCVDEHTIKTENKLLQALRSQDPHTLLECLIRLTQRRDDTFTSASLENLSGPVFSEILRLLDPSLFVARWSRLFEELRQFERFMLKLLPAEPVFGYERFCMRFLGQIGGIIRARCRMHPLTISDWGCLLKCARYCGHKQAAHAIWKEMQSQAKTLGMVVDAECYNHYLWTMTWSDRHNASQRYRLRFAQLNTTPRRWTSALQRPWVGHDIGVAGIRALTLETFENMANNGIIANEETFCCVIVGLGREGDLKGVANILKRVWDVDPDNLNKSHVKKPVYKKNSVLSPSRRLLLTISHVYGANNEIGTAFALIDHFSRRYNSTLRIDPEIWEELMNWTNVSAKVSRSEQKSISPFPRISTLRLWNIMTTKPHNIIPDLRMISYVMYSRFHYRRRDQAENWMKFALDLYLRSRQRFHRQQLSFVRTVDKIPPALKADRIRNLTFVNIELERDRFRIKQWVNELLFNPTWSKNPHYMTVGIPNLIMEWARYLPRTFSYYVISGMVEFPLEARVSIHDSPGLRKRPELEVHQRAASMRRGSRHIRYVGGDLPSHAIDYYAWHFKRLLRSQSAKRNYRWPFRSSPLRRHTIKLRSSRHSARTKASRYNRWRQLLRTRRAQSDTVIFKPTRIEDNASLQYPEHDHVVNQDAPKSLPAFPRLRNKLAQTNDVPSSNTSKYTPISSHNSSDTPTDQPRTPRGSITMPLSKLREAPQSFQEAEYQRLAQRLQNQYKNFFEPREKWASERQQWDDAIEEDLEGSRELMGKMDGDPWKHL